MKHCKLFIIMLALMTLFCSCAKKEQKTENIHSRIHRYFSDIGSYTAKCSITIHSQRNTVYSAVLNYDKDKKAYKLSYNDITVTVMDGKAEAEKNGTVLQTRSCEEYMPMFINNFFYYYYVGESSTLDVSDIKSFGTTILETPLGENDKNAFSQKVWIDNSTAKPVKTEIYREDGSVYMEIIYKSFVFKHPNETKQTKSNFSGR